MSRCNAPSAFNAAMRGARLAHLIMDCAESQCEPAQVNHRQGMQSTQEIYGEPLTHTSLRLKRVLSMSEPVDSDEPVVPGSAAVPASRRAPRPRRIPRSREQQARLDAREPAFEPIPFSLDAAA